MLHLTPPKIFYHSVHGRIILVNTQQWPIIEIVGGGEGRQLLGGGDVSPLPPGICSPAVFPGSTFRGAVKLSLY